MRPCALYLRCPTADFALDSQLLDGKTDIEQYNNCFINLAFVLLSFPSPSSPPSYDR